MKNDTASLVLKFITTLIDKHIDFEALNCESDTSIYIPSRYECDKNHKHTIKVIFDYIDGDIRLYAYKCPRKFNGSIDEFMEIIQDRYDESTYFEDWAE